MLKFFYRLKKRGGVVLFAVIAFMTLLITMATVAYFSARASYNTVISNYDFSQMYISTTSVSDMIIDALSETSSKAAPNATSGLNYFDGLKASVENMIKEAAKDDSKIGATLVGVSSNIAYADRDDKSKIMEAGANNAIEPGILDAIKTTIKLENVIKNTPSAGVNTYYFSVTTEGYYRNNTIKVQDIIYAEAGAKSPSDDNLFSTFFTGTAQELVGGNISPTSRMVVIDTQKISDNAYFQNKFTVFTGGNTDCAFMGGVKTCGGLYLKKIQNYNIPAPKKDGSGKVTERHDWIIGGDLWLDENITLDLNGNYLYVHGDLYVRNGHTLSAGGIFVEGNIYFLNGDGNIKIEKGTGSLTDASGNALPDGLYVNGDIKKVTDTSTEKVGTSWADGLTTLAGLASPALDPSTMTIAQMIGTINTLVNDMVSQSNLFGTGTGGNTPGVNLATGTVFKINGSTNDSSATGTTFTWADLNTVISEQTDDGKDYIDKFVTTSVDSLLDPKGGVAPVPYPSYSSDTAYSALLQLDFSKVPSTVTYGTAYEIGTVGGKSATITYPDPNTGDDETTKNINNCSNFIIDLPYVSGGYMLQYTNLSGGKIPMDPNAAGGTIRIETPNGPQKDADGNTMYMTEEVTKPDGTTETKFQLDDKGNKIEIPETMPIVLMANFDDGSSTPKDEKGFNAFRWTAAQGGNSGTVTVELVDKDDHSKSAQNFVVFEMGAYDTTTGKYRQYKVEDAGKLECPTYYAKEKEKVGSLNQVNAISALQPGSPEGSDQYKFLKTGSNDVQDGFPSNQRFDYSQYDNSKDLDNKIILVSNKNGKATSFNADGGDSTFCGYLYSPNSSYSCWNDKSSMPLFGGMIVTDYKVKLGSYLYAEPDPRLIAALGNTLKKQGGSGSKTVVETTWHTDTGKNYLG